MSQFLDTRGRSTLGIGICGRCSRKFSLEELYSDPNSPGLRVCKDDLDLYDPYKLSPRQADKIALSFVRPDDSVATSPLGIIAESGDYFIIIESQEGYIVP